MIWSLLAETLRKTMAASSGHELDKALADLGWPEMLSEMPEAAIPLVFKLLGETGAHAPVLNDVVLHEAGRPVGDNRAAAVRGRSWVALGAHRPDRHRRSTMSCRCIASTTGQPLPLAARADGRWAGGSSAPAAPCWRWPAQPRAGPRPVRAPGRVVSGHPAPAGRDARRHRRRRGDAAAATATT